MKFFDLDNNIHRKDIGKYKLDRRKKSASAGQKRLGETLHEMFPNIVIYTEVPCFGTKMRMDYFIPELNLVVEFDGEQHKTYNPFFHGSKKNFLEQQKRDFYKEEWCRNNDFRLVRVDDQTMVDLGDLIRNAE